jgi:hypothetical protein
MGASAVPYLKDTGDLCPGVVRQESEINYSHTSRCLERVELYLQFLQMRGFMAVQSVYRLGKEAGRPGFKSRQGQRWHSCLFATASRQDLRPTQPPKQWVRGVLIPRVKRPGRETDHSPPPSAEAKNVCSYTSTPQYVFMAWCLIKQWMFSWRGT